MMLMPYFMENPEWYTEEQVGDPYYDGHVEYKLTDKAPQKARESFEEYQRMQKKRIASDGKIVSF